MFKNFKNEVANNFAKLATGNLLYVSIDRDKIIEVYLSGFPEETRQEFNCSACKSFLRQYGGIVSIKNNVVRSIWDNIELPEYKKAAQLLSNYIHSLPITDVFYNDVVKCGVNRNADPKTNIIWDHFYLELDKRFIKNKDSIPTLLGSLRANKEVLKRSLDELTMESVQLILELISQGSIYRGNEFKGLLEGFLAVQREYKSVPNPQKDAYTWEKSLVISEGLCKIRNSAIGTILVDISAGVDVETAVVKFERVVAPSNYKRPTALITPRMVEDAQKEIEEAGLSLSLNRRFANEADISVDNVLFTNRIVPDKGNIFNELVKSSSVKQNFDKTEEITIDKFINDVLPKVDSVEIYLESKHSGNFVSLLTSQYENAPTMFKWDNPFSLSYTGGLADSMKERVKSAGGKVDGDLRFSIQWNEDGKNNNDFDAHAVEPRGGQHICYSTYKKPQITTHGGQLDVDIISPNGKVAVENITWPNVNRMLNGEYRFYVNNYTSSPSNAGFSAEVEFNGECHQFKYEKRLRGKENIEVAVVTLSNGKWAIIPAKDIQHGSSSVEKWGLSSNKFHKVSKIILSPNHWKQSVGNKHFLFFVDGCINNEQPRGIFNEYLREDLNKHRKVFEVLGSKLRVEPTENQLSGIGFSDTQRNEMLVKVSGQLTRTLKVKF